MYFSFSEFPGHFGVHQAGSGEGIEPPRGPGPSQSLHRRMEEIFLTVLIPANAFWPTRVSDAGMSKTGFFQLLLKTLTRDLTSSLD